MTVGDAVCRFVRGGQDVCREVADEDEDRRGYSACQ
jgi:hypothetical protein